MKRHLPVSNLSSGSIKAAGWRRPIDLMLSQSSSVVLPKLVDYITSRTRRPRILDRPQRLQLRNSLPSRRLMRPWGPLTHRKLRGPRSAVLQSLERRAVSVLHPGQKIRLASPKPKQWNGKRSPSNQIYGDACFAADLTSIIRSIVSFSCIFSCLLLLLYTPGYLPIDRRCLPFLTMYLIEFVGHIPTFLFSFLFLVVVLFSTVLTGQGQTDSMFVPVQHRSRKNEIQSSLNLGISRGTKHVCWSQA